MTVSARILLLSVHVQQVAVIAAPSSHLPAPQPSTGTADGGEAPLAARKAMWQKQAVAKQPESPPKAAKSRWQPPVPVVAEAPKSSSPPPPPAPEESTPIPRLSRALMQAWAKPDITASLLAPPPISGRAVPRGARDRTPAQ